MNHGVDIWMIRLEPAAAPQLNHPLGFMYLAAALRKVGFWNLRIIDIAPQRLTWPQVLAEIGSQRPGVIFLTACTVDMPNVARFSAAVAEVSPATRQVIGGSHPSGDPEGTLETVPHADVVVFGEAEQTSAELLEALETEGDAGLAEVKGIAFRAGDGEVIRNSARPIPQRLDDDLWPAYDLIDIPTYFRWPRMGLLFQRQEYMSLFTSRGCVYKCEFCHEVFGKGFRAYSAGRVLDEMEFLVRKHGIREFQVLDDLFNQDRTRTLDICAGIKQRGLDVRFCFPNGLRADRLIEDEIRALSEAGAWRVCVSPETASERLQKLIGKRIDLEAVHQSIEWLVKYKVFTTGYFMLGFPTETEAELRQTIRWALDSKLHTANFFRVIPFPGSRLRDRAESEGAELDRNPRAYEGAGSSFNLSTIPRDRIEKLHRQAVRSFFWNPVRMARLAKALPKHPTLLPLYGYELLVRLALGTVGPQVIGKLQGPDGVKALWSWVRTGNAYDDVRD